MKELQINRLLIILVCCQILYLPKGFCKGKVFECEAKIGQNIKNGIYCERENRTNLLRKNYKFILRAVCLARIRDLL